jgi:hypothetical protein
MSSQPPINGRAAAVSASSGLAADFDFRMPAATRRSISTARRLRASPWFWPAISAAALFLLALLACLYIYSSCVVYGPPIRSDGFGYYSYLPAIFIDHDLTMRTPKAFEWTVVGSHPLPYAWDGLWTYPGTGKLLQKYTIGTALLQTPFFLAAHITSNLLGWAPNGYSVPYQMANVLSGIAYLSLGTLLLCRFLLRRFSLVDSILTISAIVFATGVFHYGTYDQFSHIYSYCLLSALLTAIDFYRERSSRKAAPQWLAATAMGAITGLIALTRVPNVIAALLPIACVCEQWSRSRDTRRFCRELGTGLVSFVFVFGPQLAYWHAVTGHLILNSYGSEHFNWLNPHILNILFSPNHGLVFWTPMMAIVPFGLGLLARKDKWLAIGIGGVLALEIYICSSWWTWSFGGGGFGSRPFVDMMPLIALPLGHAFAWVGVRVGHSAVALVIAALIALNLFLMLSMWQAQIPSNTRFADFLALPLKWKTHPLGQLGPIPYLTGRPFLSQRPPPPSIQMSGWETRAAPAVWTIGKHASLTIKPILETPGDLRLRILFGGNGALLSSKHPSQRAIVKANGATIGGFVLRWNERDREKTLRIPFDLVYNMRPLRIDIELPDAIAPRDLAINADTRLLGLYVSRISVDSAERSR